MMQRFFICMACFVVFTIAISARPALAFSVTASASPAAYNGACPATITFTGMVNGAGSGQAIAYHFVYYDPATKTVKGPYAGGSGTIPATGQLKVVATLSVPPVSAGAAWVEFQATVATTTQLSPQAAFSVTCAGSPTPQPSSAPVDKSLGVPVNLNSTTSQSVCGQHGGLAGLFCPDALHNGYVVLVWDYANQGAVDGYHVYESDQGQHTLVDDQKNNQATISFLKPQSQTLTGRCYVVTAYKNGADSGASNQYCELGVASSPIRLGATGSANIVMLGNPTWSGRVNKYSSSTIFSGVQEWGTGDPCSGPCVGYVNNKSGDSITLAHDIDVYRAYLSFDPSKIQGLTVYQATLQLPLQQAVKNCYRGVGPALSSFTGNVDWVQGDFSYNEPGKLDLNAMMLTLDVTSIVRNWATGKIPNFGFVLDGAGDSGSPDNTSCTVVFKKNATLSIEHY